MLDQSGWTLLTAAANVFEAQLLAGALKNEGIPTHVDADLLADEFSMSRKMMGVDEVRVLVPTGQLDLARRVLQAVRARQPVSTDDLPWDAPDPDAEEDD